ncbi:hypothetical protein JRO89_XS01G0270800 [Xanthoceras sorbifolium]|uniref:Uncharacterized protein n=1 Tax=Xanthoceras sorbifolium TaxID=99658 RepID=A0ABQ8ILL4_9ROSI|nr:hypothetical protein JRO89_XS01G0270800 [Xanthoceras sorbifolium]
MWAQPNRKTDVEAGARPLYPMMLESPELRWAFIRKIYSILTIQLLATIAVAATVVTVRPIAVFFSTTGAGLALYIVLIITPFIGKVILESVILTTVVVVSLTLYTFWAARRGHDFNFLGPFLFGAIIVLMVFALIQCLNISQKVKLFVRKACFNWLYSKLNLANHGIPIDPVCPGCSKGPESTLHALWTYDHLSQIRLDCGVPDGVGHVGLGVVIRDCFGHILLADTKLGGFGLSPQLAGAEAMCFDLLLAVGASFSPIYLELQWL